MKRLLRRLLSPLLGEIEIYQVLRRDRPGSRTADDEPAAFKLLQAEDIEHAPSDTIRDRAWYAGPQAAGYGWYDGVELVAVCFFWWGERYEARNFWPLGPGQAKLVEIVTAESHRGRGIARELIAHASAAMFRQGFERLYARVWHSNHPSLTAFGAAGWQRAATVITCKPPWRRRRALRVTLGQRPEGPSAPI